MKKVFIHICLLLFITLTLGCVQNISDPVLEEPEAPEVIDNDNGLGFNDENTVVEVTEHEYSDEEKALIMIDKDKIILAVINYETGKCDDLGLLISRYPDAIMTSKEYVDKDRFGEDERNEVWYIDAGLSYSVYHFINGNEIYGKSNMPMNWIQEIRGKASGLIAGLIAPIEVRELMEQLEIPENAWAINSWPSDPGFYDYVYKNRNDAKEGNSDMVSVGIVVADPNNEEYPIGIWVELSKSGYISPDDEIVITSVAAKP